MSKKIYRVSETQLKNVLETIKKERELTETPKENLDEVGEGSRVFRSEIGYINLDANRSDELRRTIFNQIPAGYNIDLSYRQAKASYTIGFEYRDYGIKEIYLSPVGISLMGELNIDGDDVEYSNDFEIVYDQGGLKENTLSGTIQLGDRTVRIGDIPKTAEFETKSGANTDGVYVVSVEFEEGVDSFKFIFEY